MGKLETYLVRGKNLLEGNVKSNFVHLLQIFNNFKRHWEKINRKEKVVVAQLACNR